MMPPCPDECPLCCFDKKYGERFSLAVIFIALVLFVLFR